jgi:hypothetical protein
MTDIQILTIALAIIVPMSSLIYSNSRITEVKETLRADMKTMHTELMARLDAIETFLHQAVMGKLDELDRRLTALEGRR